ncbi:MAG: hypothetical protein JW934_00795 [Anaerolineae bacterium]|nr:hypothetical protein [Anaerolineae bacterium]
MSALARIRPLIADLGCCGAVACQLPVSARCAELAPSEANTLIVAGRVTAAFAPVLREFYAQLAAPRWVIAVGTCALAGDMFDTIPAAEVIPVDVSLPGCPPSLDALCAVLASLPRRRRA